VTAPRVLAKGLFSSLFSLLCFGLKARIVPRDRNCPFLLTPLSLPTSHRRNSFLQPLVRLSPWASRVFFVHPLLASANLPLSLSPSHPFLFVFRIPFSHGFCRRRRASFPATMAPPCRWNDPPATPSPHVGALFCLSFVFVVLADLFLARLRAIRSSLSDSSNQQQDQRSRRFVFPASPQPTFVFLFFDSS